MSTTTLQQWGQVPPGHSANPAQRSGPPSPAEVEQRAVRLREQAAGNEPVVPRTE
jgi:hypothetical protein